MESIEVCEHCGQELQKASKERQQIQRTQLDNIDDVKIALTERQDKLDSASQEMLEIIQRIEYKLGADEQTRNDIKELEAKIRSKIAAQAKSEDESE